MTFCSIWQHCSVCYQRWAEQWNLLSQWNQFSGQLFNWWENNQGFKFKNKLKVQAEVRPVEQILWTASQTSRYDNSVEISQFLQWVFTPAFSTIHIHLWSRMSSVDEAMVRWRWSHSWNKEDCGPRHTASGQKTYQAIKKSCPDISYSFNLYYTDHRGNSPLHLIHSPCEWCRCLLSDVAGNS